MKQNLAKLSGPILLTLGLLLPTANAQVYQRSSIYLLNPNYFGIPILILAAAAFAILVLKKFKFLPILGLVALALVLIDGIDFWQWMDVNNEARNAVKYSIFGGMISGDVLEIVEPGIAWLFLVLGSLACVASPFLDRWARSRA